MKRSTASWTTAIAASALLAMPVGSWAQQTSPTPSQTPSASRPAGEQSSSNEHLRKAETALNDIPAASLTGTAKSRVAELKRHITALQRSSSAGKVSAPAGKSSTSASTELAAADRILTELLGGEGTTGAPEPGAAGTTGKTASKAAPGLDDAAKAKLQEVRTHLTAFAASMGSTPSPGAEDPSASASAAAAAAAASPSTPSASPSQTPSSTTTTASPATTPAPTEPAAATPPAQAQAGQQPPAGAQSVDTDAVKKHLTAARESLSQLTQLPAAAQLTGDARTQVSQLISNFNELISTNTDWRASYSKVQANLNSLVGDQRADESPATPATPAPGAAGAVGTSGTSTVDPTIRAKLVEFRTHLMEFEKAAGGASASASPAASPATPADPAAAAAQPSPTSPSTPPSTPPAVAPTEPTPPAAAPTTPAEPSPSTPTPTGTSGRTAPAPAGTTGTTAPAADSPDQSAKAQSGHSDAMRHIEAIEAILNGSSGAAGTTGSATSKPAAGASSLNREQIEQIRTHLAELRKALNQSSK